MDANNKNDMNKETQQIDQQTYKKVRIVDGSTEEISEEIDTKNC